MPFIRNPEAKPKHESDNPMVHITIRVTHNQARYARKKGNGNISAGVRASLQEHLELKNKKS